MADARGDASAAAGDVVELQGQGAVTVDVSGVHGGAGKLAIAADVEKKVAGSTSALQKVTASSGTVNPDTAMRSLARSRRYLHLLCSRILACRLSWIG